MRPGRVNYVLVCGLLERLATAAALGLMCSTLGVHAIDFSSTSDF